MRSRMDRRAGRGYAVAFARPPGRARTTGGASVNSPRPAAPGGVSPWPISRGDYPLRLRASFPSTKAALNRAVRAVMTMARRSGCPAGDFANVEIALREAIANAIIHGNALHRGKRILLRCYGGPHKALLVLVRDEGPGFDPGRVPDPRHPERLHLHHGRGLLLMRELMDYVEYRKGGREVVLFKICR